MYGKIPSRKTGALGVSRLQTGFLALLVVFGGLLAVTKYLDLSLVVEGSMEQGVIKAVRQGIAAYAAESRKLGSTSLYPPLLDDAKTGIATSQNLFFSNVLQRGIAVEGWVKEGQYEYRTPTGGKFIYDPLMGSFETHESIAARGMDHPSQTPKPDSGAR